MYGFRPVHKFRERGPKTSFHMEIPDFQVNVYVYVCFHRAAYYQNRVENRVENRVGDPIFHPILDPILPQKPPIQVRPTEIEDLILGLLNYDTTKRFHFFARLVRVSVRTTGGAGL